MPNDIKKDPRNEKYAHLRLDVEPDEEQDGSIDLAAAYETLLSAYQREQLMNEEGK